MKVYGLYESAAVKVQTIKTAIEVCSLLSPLSQSTDDIVPVCMSPPPSRQVRPPHFHLESSY